MHKGDHSSGNRPCLHTVYLCYIAQCHYKVALASLVALPFHSKRDMSSMSGEQEDEDDLARSLASHHNDRNVRLKPVAKGQRAARAESSIDEIRNTATPLHPNGIRTLVLIPDVPSSRIDPDARLFHPSLAASASHHRLETKATRSASESVIKGKRQSPCSPHASPCISSLTATRCCSPIFYRLFRRLHPSCRPLVASISPTAYDLLTHFDEDDAEQTFSTVFTSPELITIPFTRPRPQHVTSRPLASINQHVGQVILASRPCGRDRQRAIFSYIGCRCPYHRDFIRRCRGHVDVCNHRHRRVDFDTQGRCAVKLCDPVSA